MKTLANDFLTESETLHALVAPLSDAELEQATAFKDWPIARVIQHLHAWNMAAEMSLKGMGLSRLTMRSLKCIAQAAGRWGVLSESGSRTWRTEAG